jgi:hypothetical protein
VVAVKASGTKVLVRAETEQDLLSRDAGYKQGKAG